MKDRLFALVMLACLMGVGMILLVDMLHLRKVMDLLDLTWR